MDIKETSFWKKLYHWKRKILSTIAPQFLSKDLFYQCFHKKLDLKNPKDINEKIHYLKLHDYNGNPIITQCADKYGVRRYLQEKGYGGLLPKLYGVYDSPYEIEWDSLPKEFVIKCNHGCGYNILCADKEKLNKEETIRTLKKWLKTNYWKEYAEVQYKYIKKKIIIEEFLGNDIQTYKFYCFNGEPKILYVSENGEDGIKDKYIDYYDMQFVRQQVRLRGHENIPHSLEKPKNFHKMATIAEELSKDFKFVRVDLYNIEGMIYMSEMTFVPTGGFMTLEPEDTIVRWGGVVGYLVT